MIEGIGRKEKDDALGLLGVIAGVVHGNNEGFILVAVLTIPSLVLSASFLLRSQSLTIERRGKGDIIKRAVGVLDGVINAVIVFWTIDVVITADFFFLFKMLIVDFVVSF